MDAKPVPRLPSEIWLMILDCLPPSFFQQDISRLALSKQWYSLAFPAFYPRIEFTPRVISRLVHGKSKSLEKSRARLRKSLRSIHIVLEGGDLGADTASRFNTPANLSRFCLMLLEFRELKTVRFSARWQNPEWRADPLRTDYLVCRSIDPYLRLLAPSLNLTSLDLDLCGTHVLNDSRTQPLHFCPHIRPLLSRLRSLRLRAKSLCEVAVQPYYHDHLDPTIDDAGHQPTALPLPLPPPPSQPRPLPLSHLTISLYLGPVSSHNPKLNLTRTCRPLPPATPAILNPFILAPALPPAANNASLASLQPPPSSSSWPWSCPMNSLRAALRQLVGQMSEPRKAEMVHLTPGGEVCVWDARTDRCVRGSGEGSDGVVVGAGCFGEEAERFWAGGVNGGGGGGGDGGGGDQDGDGEFAGGSLSDASVSDSGGVEPPEGVGIGEVLDVDDGDGGLEVGEDGHV